MAKNVKSPDYFLFFKAGSSIYPPANTIIHMEAKELNYGKAKKKVCMK